MKRILLVCLSVILVTGLLPGASATGSRPADNNNSIRTGQDMVLPGRSEGLQVYEFGGKRVMAEVRKGLGVKLRATQLRKKNKGFAKAYKDLIKRGRKPIFEEAGMTVLGVDTSRPAIKQMAFGGSQDIVDGDYEMSFFPVDTGNPNVWEGLVYVKGPGGDGTYAVAHDTTHGDLSQTEVYYETYYPGDGGGGDLQQSMLPGRGHGSVRAVSFGAAAVGVTPSPMTSRWAIFLGCIAAAIYEVALACRFSGPFFWHCLAFGAVGVIIGCLILTW